MDSPALAIHPRTPRVREGMDRQHRAKSRLEGRLMHLSLPPKLASPLNKTIPNQQPVGSERTAKKKDRKTHPMISPSVVADVDHATVAGAVAPVLSAAHTLAAAVARMHDSGAITPSGPELIPGGVVGGSPSIAREVPMNPEVDLKPHPSISPPSSRTSAPSLVST